MKESLDIANLAAGYAKGSFAAIDVIAEVYDRIANYGEQPVWISLRSKQDALERARTASHGPLYGIPFAVKDNIDVAGLPTTCACAEFAYVPERSATVVERLEAAGAIFIGKTNLDQFATGLVGTRSSYGIPSNTFDKTYISGGSSSGSAVAVASGLVSFALGTDTAGSGRVPAAFNNIVGLKPTKGLMSTRGVVPACRTQDTVSIFALTVADACRVFSATSAFDPEDSFARRPLADRVTDCVSSPLRVGVPSAPLEFFGDVESARLYKAAVERAQALGATIVGIEFTPFQQAASLLYQGPWVAERLAAIKSFAVEKPHAIHEVVREIIFEAEKLTAVNAFEGLYRLADLRRSGEAEWQKMDMLLLPTAPTIYTIADVLSDPLRLNSNLGLYTNFVNLMDLSALAIPAGFRADGLPFGVSLVGPAFDDKKLAVFADRMHRSMIDLRLGATDCLLGKSPALETPVAVGNLIQLAVVGAHLCGQPLNRQLIERNARLVCTARTAPGYSFYALANTMPPKPGLVYDGKGLGGIEVEVWEMAAEELGSFVGLIPPPLGIGTLTLQDGTLVKGFLCESYAVEGAEDITSLGGWRAWIGRH